MVGSATWITGGGPFSTVRGKVSYKERLMEERGGYLWFEDVRVVAENMRLHCIAAGRVVPFPVAILHRDCTLSAHGDVGRLGVPRRWAEERGLCD
jgi:hypothetical protein